MFKALRQIGALAFVLGLFTVVFIGMPWAMLVSTDPVVPWWLRTAVFCLLGGILFVLLTLALEQRKTLASGEGLLPAEPESKILLLNAPAIPGRDVKEILGMVQGHTVFAILRLILGGELTEYTDMMGKARAAATTRMINEATAMGADAIINVRYMTTSVVGTAAELFAYGTAVKLGN